MATTKLKSAVERPPGSSASPPRPQQSGRDQRPIAEKPRPTTPTPPASLGTYQCWFRWNGSETQLKRFFEVCEDMRQSSSATLWWPTNEGLAVSKLLDLLYREYTRSRMAEMDAAGDFANVWRMANYRRSEDIAQSIAEALRSEKNPANVEQHLPPNVGRA
jgi:hypothetical protein